MVLLIAGSGASYQILAERREAKRFPAPGRLVDIGGRRLHVMCSGRGTPGVLIEASGLGTALQSAAVQRELATTQRVCSYDRAGLGWSDSSPYPATAKAMEQDLEQLLDKIDLRAPLILVASSAGGLSAEQIRRAPPIQSTIPAIVLVHGQPRDIDPSASAATLAELEPKWRAAQAQFSGRFTRSKLVVVENSGHLIVTERPDAVVKAVRDVQRLAADSSSN